MEKPIIFISHITEEKELAFHIKDYIENAFLGYAQVFVSSHGDSISAGDRWLQKVDDALKTCVMELILCSPSSVTRPWIQFEAGAAWGRGIPIIPLCHSGATPSTNPVPLSELQGVLINQQPGIRKMTDSIARTLELRSPQSDVDSLLNDILAFEETYMLGDDIVHFFDAVGGSSKALGLLKSQLSQCNSVIMNLGEITSEKYSELKSLLVPKLKEFFSFTSHTPSLNFGPEGAISMIKVELYVKHLSRVVELLEQALG